MPAVDVGLRSLTARDKERLAQQDGVEVWGFTRHEYTEEEKRTRTLDAEGIVLMKALLRRQYEALLDHLPEASDEELRSLVLEESSHPKDMRDFFLRYSAHARTATCRFIPNVTVRTSFAILRRAAALKQQFGADELKFKEELGKFLLSMKEKAYYSSRSFDEVVASGPLKTAPISSEHRVLLAARRAAGDRPGAGLLERDENEMKVAQRDAMRHAFQADLTARDAGASQPAPVVGE